MGTWTSVSKLSVVIESGKQECKIYGNSLNRIGVVISVQPTDDDGNTVRVDSDTLIDSTVLIDYVDQTKLNWRGGSDWCYTDTPNEFHTIPDLGELAEIKTESNGTQTVTYYVYCSADTRLRNKSIGVRIKPTGGDAVYSSLNGTYHSQVEIAVLDTFFYKKGDIGWNYERADASSEHCWNYYLSCAKSGFHFVKFEVHSLSTQSGQDGLMGWKIGGNWKDFHGVYAWYQEPHKDTRRTIVNFPGDWSDSARVYTKGNENRELLCFTWVRNWHGGGGTWHLPNDPMTHWWQYYSTYVDAYDQYGNSGRFWPDTRNIDDGLDIYDHDPNPGSEMSASASPQSGDEQP